MCVTFPLPVSRSSLGNDNCAASGSARISPIHHPLIYITSWGALQWKQSTVVARQTRAQLAPSRTRRDCVDIIQHVRPSVRRRCKRIGNEREGLEDADASIHLASFSFAFLSFWLMWLSRRAGIDLYIKAVESHPAMERMKEREKDEDTRADDGRRVE